MQLPDPTQTFLQEAEDLLVTIEAIALDLENAPSDLEAINRMFRAFHTIKGSGAMFGFDRVAGFTHHVETALDKVRGGTIAVTAEILELLLSSRDHISTLLRGDSGSVVDGEGDRIIAGLLRASDLNPVGHTVAPWVPSADAKATTGFYVIEFIPCRELTTRGFDPAAILDELRALGECDILVHRDKIPELGALNAEHCYLSWTVRLRTDATEAVLRGVFLFVEDDCEVRICQAEDPMVAAPVGVASQTAPAEKALHATDATPERKRTGEATLRVSAEKLDRLVNLVGELVMNQSRLVQVSTRLNDGELSVPVEAIERLVAELRDTILGVRMMPIGSTFGRFRRLVHDLSHELGKEVDLVTEGADTELDKSVLDQIGDPLIHLIRNSLDHGIEDPDTREAAGKPRRGHVRLSAAHEGSQVVITIEDNGKGLDVGAIRAKAVEKGLLSADSALGDREIFNLIFLPGFSTAKSVTSVSGRGVGMDVVKRQIEALRGGIQIESKRGEGTTIRLTLPLTLAIIDGLLVEVDGERFIIPMAAVAENVEITRTERASQNGRNLISVRGELISYIRLREVFALGEIENHIEKIVITRHEGRRVGVVVDRVLGSHQTVIQSLGRLYKGIDVCSGATILGDGRVALIFSVPGLIAQAERCAAAGRLAA